MNTIFTREEEAVFIKAAQNGDKKALNTFVAKNIPLAKYFVKGYYREFLLERPDLKSDLVQEGILGLYLAVEKMNLELDVRFSTYAAYWVRAKAGKFIHDYTKGVWKSMSDEEVDFDEIEGAAESVDPMFSDNFYQKSVKPLRINDLFSFTEKHFNDIERFVIRAKYQRGKTSQEIADELHCSKKYICDVEKHALSLAGGELRTAMRVSCESWDNPVSKD
ncbi:MAG: sigma-70 family RNA polymerase sigma factor [Anaerolineaceae bacterium]|nr:sigma-70 family RNA polymerase sigma factor [Anaerolineaceae bacterium]